MQRLRLPVSLLLAFALLLLQFGAALAAPTARSVAATGPITGTVESITLDTSTTPTTVVVTVKDSTGATQTVHLSLADAAQLGLITIDPATGQPAVNEGAIGTSISIDPGIIIPSEEGKQHPVASALAAFFADLSGVDYNLIMQYHEDGMGFGVIAQALWMTKALEGDSETFAAILDAKRSHDFSAITLPDGSTPKNWGQFMKALLSGDRKQNLGAIMSGRAEGSGTLTDRPGNGHGRGIGHGRGHGPKH